MKYHPEGTVVVTIAATNDKELKKLALEHLRIVLTDVQLLQAKKGSSGKVSTELDT